MWRNWSGGQRCAPEVYAQPGTTEELSTALREAAEAGRRVRVTGAGHSFSDVVPTDGTLIHLGKLDRILEVDKARGRVRVQAGITLNALNAALATHGLAMANLGDIDLQSLAGAISTATHGTGAALPNLSAQVEAIELVTADGRILTCAQGDADPDTFLAARVGVGALGVISTVTLRCVPAFNLHAVDRPVPLDHVLDGLDEWVGGNDHFEFFIFPHAKHALTRTNNRTTAPAAPRSALRAWVEDILLENHALNLVCSLGRAFPSLIPALNRMVTRMAGSADRVDRSDRVFASPRTIRFEEMEYALPIGAAREAVRGVLKLIEEKHPAINFPLEVRFVAPDDALLSPASHRATCYLAVHVYRGMTYEPFFRDVEALMNGLDGRPHWGKRHTQSAATLATRYPGWARFQAVRARLDPRGLFTSPAIERVLGPIATG